MKIKTCIVYAGPHYGREHEILSRAGRNMTVKHSDGEPFTVCLCDTDCLSPTVSSASDSVHYKRVFDALLDRGFAESEEASAEQWADELVAAVADLTNERIRNTQNRITREDTICDLKREVQRLNAEAMSRHGQAVENALLAKHPTTI